MSNAPQFIHTSDLCGNGTTHAFGSFVDDLHIDIRVQPLGSKVTIAALADLGYRVDYAKAESYALPGRLVAGPLLHIREQVHRGPLQAPAFPERDIPVIPP